MRTREETPTGERRAYRRGDRTVERRGWKPGAGMLLGLLGTAGVVISMFLSWDGNTATKPHGVPFAFLWDHSNTSGRPSILIALIPIAVVMAIGSVLPGGGPARFLAGVAAVVVAGLFAWSLHRAGAGLGNALDTGWYFAAIGGLIGLVSGLVPTGVVTGRMVEHQYGGDEQYDDGDREDRAVDDVRGDREYAGSRRRRLFR